MLLNGGFNYQFRCYTAEIAHAIRKYSDLLLNVGANGIDYRTRNIPIPRQENEGVDVKGKINLRSTGFPTTLLISCVVKCMNKQALHKESVQGWERGKILPFISPQNTPFCQSTKHLCCCLSNP